MNIMKIIEFNHPNDVLNKEEVAICIGAFDGIHLGHQQLINKLQETKLKRALLTFNPTPKAYFSDDYSYLTPIDKKISLLENLVDYVFIINFNDDFKNMSKQDFITFLKNNATLEVICGHDFTFAKNKEGKAEDLRCFNLTVMNPYLIDGKRVATTAIKDFLTNGNILEANKFLGRNYSIKSEVIHGSNLGHTIGFPTANMTSNSYFIPLSGVYVTKTLYKGHLYMSMTNIGKNPTMNAQDEIRIETYLLNFEGNLYDEEIEVFFVDRIRDEKKFSSVSILVEELTANANYVRVYDET